MVGLLYWKMASETSRMLHGSCIHTGSLPLPVNQVLVLRVQRNTSVVSTAVQGDPQIGRR